MGAAESMETVEAAIFLAADAQGDDNEIAELISDQMVDLFRNKNNTAGYLSLLDTDSGRATTKHLSERAKRRLNLAFEKTAAKIQILNKA